MIVSDKHINPENSKNRCILKCNLGDSDIDDHVFAHVFTMFSGEMNQTL